MMRVFITTLGIGLLIAAGCSNSAETKRSEPYALSERNLQSVAARLSETVVDSTAAARRAQYAARKMREAGLTPAFEDSFLEFFGLTGRGEGDPAQAHVLGYIPGRNPSYAERLILIAADLDGPGAAASLEVGRRLALEALDTQVPERTVLVALLGPPRTGNAGIADFVSHPTWALEGIDHAIIITADMSQVTPSQSLLAAHGIRSDIIETPQAATTVTSGVASEQSPLVAFTESLYRRTRGLANTADSLGHNVEVKE